MQELSNETSARISVDTVISNRFTEDVQFLSDEIETTNMNLNSETRNRILEDGKLLTTILSVNDDSITRDNILSDALLAHEQCNIEEFAQADAKMLSTVEHERHYFINNVGTTASYPFVVKDYAVNVFRASIPAGRVLFNNTDTGITSEVGKIKLDGAGDKLPFTFTTYDNIQDPAIASALVGGKPYGFTESQKWQYTYANGYTIQYEIPDLADAQLSDAKLTLIPQLPRYHKVYLSGTSDMIGKFYDATPEGESSELTAGWLYIDTGNIELDVFNKFFKDVHFNTTDDKSHKFQTERVTYLGSNELCLEKNIDAAKYLQLTDVSNDTHVEFRKIYDYKNGISGIVSSDSGELLELNVHIEHPDVAVAYLNKDNGFSTVIRNTATSETIVSAEIYDNTSADIDVVYRSELYKYEFTRPDDVGVIKEIGAVIPNVYNKVLHDKPVYDTVSVDTTNITNIDAFKKVWVLTRAFPYDPATQGLWSVEGADDNGNTINIKYTEFNVFVKITSIDGSITRRKYDVKTEEPIIANPDTCHEVKYCSGTVDLAQARIDVEKPEKTYCATIAPEESVDPFKSYTLDIDTGDNDTFKFEFPDKTTPDISREFFITVKFDSAIKKLVKADFRYKDGSEVTIFNNKHTDLWITANSDPKDWVTYMVNEVQPNKFLVTDLNDYEDHQILEQLLHDVDYLSGQHDWLSTQLSLEISANNVDIEYLSSEISSNDNDITQLSTDVSTKIWIKDPASAEFSSGKYTDLSVVKIPIDEYKNNSISSTLIDNTLYVISSDYIEAFGQVISNMTMTDDPTESEAASKHYVDTIHDNLSGKIQYLSSEISSNDVDISNLSGDLSSLSGHYYKTLSTDISVYYPPDPDGSISTVVDQLLIKDELTFDLYRLTIRNGALNINRVEKFIPPTLPA